MRYFKVIYSVLATFLAFFILCAFVVTCSFLLFFQNIKIPDEQIQNASLYTFFNIVFISIIFVALDTIRRKITVERPVKQIKNALHEITNGDFNVRLNTNCNQNNFTEIMESINYMTKELSGVETLRNDFIANVSHELKTPLAVIHNYGILLQESNLSEEKRLEYAKIVTKTSDKLSNLITNILKLNRLENQQIYPQTKKYNLGEQICECLLQFESVWEKSEIEIETDIADNIAIKADDELLALVWSNLFSNAFKFTDKGGKVSVSLTANEEYAIVEVSDTGCGMSPEVGRHIFEKFYQGDTSHATKGNGLGLALVKRIIDIMNGEISVSSTQNVGSIFKVKLRRDF